MATLQVGNPRRLRLVGTLEGGAELEGRLHQRFAHLRIAGEWFRAERELRQFIRAQFTALGLRRKPSERAARANPRCVLGLCDHPEHAVSLDCVHGACGCPAECRACDKHVHPSRCCRS